MADGDAPVSRALLLTCAAVSLFCSLHALLHAPQSLPGHGGGGASLLGEGGAAAAWGMGAGAGVGVRVGVWEVICAWLAWPTVAEAFVGSILLLRLFSCERHVGSRRVASFFVCALVVSAACAISHALLLRKLGGGGAAVAAAALGCRGWAPSVVYGALLVRHLVEVPTRARFMLFGRAHVSDKGVEVLLALQVPPTHQHKTRARTRTHAHCCVKALTIRSGRWQCVGALALSFPSLLGSSLAWHLPTYNRSSD